MDTKKILYKILNLFVPVARLLQIRTGWMKSLRYNTNHSMMHQGRMFYFDDNDDGYLIKGGYEKGEIKYLKTIMKPDWTAIDVGANIGYFSVIFGSYCSKVFAIEPFFKNLVLLKKNTVDLPVTITEGVASDITGEIELHIPERKTDCSIKPSNERTTSITVKSYRLDDLIKEKIDLIKIDVQGAETEVLLGAKKLIGKFRPVMLIEYENPPASLLETLKSFQYKFYSVNSKGHLIPRDYSNFNGKQENIIALHYLDKHNIGSN